MQARPIYSITGFSGAKGTSHQCCQRQEQQMNPDQQITAGSSGATGTRTKPQQHTRMPCQSSITSVPSSCCGCVGGDGFALKFGRE
eukprot:scaffold145518_cov22-Tisochrysis_lutea.AAC.1